MNKFEIEFWPKYKTYFLSEWDEGAEDNVLCDYIIANGWPGGSESSGGRQRFMVWVRYIGPEGEEDEPA